MMTTVIGNSYAPSVAYFKDLKKAMLKDLTLETNHRGSYLVLRFVCPAMRMTAVMNVVEDEAGTVMPFALCICKIRKLSEQLKIFSKTKALSS